MAQRPPSFVALLAIVLWGACAEPEREPSLGFSPPSATAGGGAGRDATASDDTSPIGQDGTEGPDGSGEEVVLTDGAAEDALGESVPDAVSTDTDGADAPPEDLGWVDSGSAVDLDVVSVDVAVDGESPDGATPDGEAPDGESLPGDVTDPDDGSPSDVGPDDVLAADVLAADVPPDDVLPDDVLLDDVLPDDVLPDDVLPDDVLAGEDGGSDTAGDAGQGFVDTWTPPENLCASKVLTPWSRKLRGVGGTVVFSELMYHGAEWLELYNPLAVDVDLSGWRLDGSVQYTFPEGTVVAAGTYRLVTGLLGTLPDDGGTVELRTQTARLMDRIVYSDSDPWPVGPDGSGCSLAKREPTLPSEAAESWGAGPLGGTPGARNAPLEPMPSTALLVPLDASWRYDASGGPAPDGWTLPGFDDQAWPMAPAPFSAGAAPPASQEAVAVVTADNYFALYVGNADGTDLRLIGRDAVGDWTSAETLTFDVSPEDTLFLAAWEAKGSDGGPQMVIGEVWLDGESALATAASRFEWVLGATGASPGGSLSAPAPSVETIASLVAASDVGDAWAEPAAEAVSTSSPWGYAVAGDVSPAAHFIWADTFGGASVSNAQETFVLFRSKSPIVAPPGATVLPSAATTVRFRTEFEDPAAAAAGLITTALWLGTLIDDGALVTLNGVEVARLNLPSGAVTDGTPALLAIGEPTFVGGTMLSTDALLPGTNVLAIEVHQAADGAADLTFAASLTAESTVTAESPGNAAQSEVGLRLSEVGAGWIELTNTAAEPVETTGAVLTVAGLDTMLPTGTLAPGAWLVVAVGSADAAAAPGDAVFLYAPGKAALLDAVRIMDAPRCFIPGSITPEGPIGGLGGWRYEDASTPGAANLVGVEDGIVVSEVLYHPAPVDVDGTPTESAEEWIELANRSADAIDVSGWQLVDAIEFTIPPGTVVPAGGYLVIARDAAALAEQHPNTLVVGETVIGNYLGGLANSGERIELRDGCGNPVDVVSYADGGRWPEAAGGGGSSLERRDLRADGSSAEVWAASDTWTAGSWTDVTVEGVLAPSSLGPDGQWQELVIGLLDAGTVLIDDVSVIEDPNGSPVELLANGTFDTVGPGTGAAGEAAAHWRLLGNHRLSRVVEDPEQPGNRVLALQATGQTEHMHNHAETTLLAGHPLTNGKTYRISMRARWMSGTNLLNSRLYFNRLAKTTALPRPTHTGTPGLANTAAVSNLGPTFDVLRHWPPVPAPYQPVTVSVRASDPDAVAGVSLWTSTGGSVVMQEQADGRYAVTIPGQAAGVITQMVVTAEDGLGAQASFPGGGSASRALWQVDDGVKSTTGLHDFRIIMTGEDRDWLLQPTNLMSNFLVPATVIVDGRDVFYDVGVRLKGSERGRPQPARIGFAVRFGRDQLFRGVYSGVNVDRSEGIGYGQREMLINAVTAHAGSVSAQYDDLVHLVSPSPDATGPAALQLARFSDLLLDNQFESGGDGMLFEYELIYFPTTTEGGAPDGLKLPQPDTVVGTRLKGLGPDKEAYRLPFIIKSNRWRDDYSTLIAFLQVFGLSGADFSAQVGAVADVDEWLRAFAFATLSGAVDNYAAGSQHNGELYVRPSDKRVIYLPHDLDFYGGSPQSPLVNSNDLAKLIATPERARQYYGHLHDILTTSYNATYLQPWCAHFGALLPSQNFASHCQFIATRSAWASAQIEATIPKVAFAITTPAGSVPAGPVTLDGTGWVDVAQIRRSGLPLSVTWTSATTWQVTAKALCGPTSLVLEARDRNGAVIGTASVELIGTRNGCP